MSKAIMKDGKLVHGVIHCTCDKFDKFTVAHDPKIETVGHYTVVKKPEGGEGVCYHPNTCFRRGE